MIITNSGIGYKDTLRTVCVRRTVDRVGGTRVTIITHNRGGNASTSGHIANSWVAEVSAAHFEGEGTVSGIARINSARIIIIANNRLNYAFTSSFVASRGEAKVCGSARLGSKHASGVGTNGLARIVCARVSIIADDWIRTTSLDWIAREWVAQISSGTRNGNEAAVGLGSSANARISRASSLIVANDRNDLAGGGGGRVVARAGLAGVCPGAGGSSARNTEFGNGSKGAVSSGNAAAIGGTRVSIIAGLIGLSTAIDLVTRSNLAFVVGGATNRSERTISTGIRAVI